MKRFLAILILGILAVDGLMHVAMMGFGMGGMGAEIAIACHGDECAIGTVDECIQHCLTQTQQQRFLPPMMMTFISATLAVIVVLFVAASRDAIPLARDEIGKFLLRRHLAPVIILS